MERKPYELSPLTSVEQYPLYRKAIALCVETRLRVAKFNRACKYDLGADINSASTEMMVFVIDGLGFPITMAQDKIDCFKGAYHFLKRINALLTVANCMNCISDRDKALIDEHLRDVAGQIRKVSNGLIRRNDENIGAESQCETRENV